MENSIVEIKNLTKIYSKSVTALHQVNLSLERGKIIGLLGPNGAGKTTLIKILTGTIRSFEGNVLVDGEPLGIHSRSVISYLPDGDFLDNEWTVEYCLEYYGDFFADFDREKALKLLNQMDISLKSRFKTLSKGTKEKIQLILTLSRRAKLYIFDEPIAGVDPAARDLIFKLIIENCDRNSTILISTHLISDAEKILDEYIFIKKGIIIEQGNVQETIERTGKSIDEIFREEFKCLGDF